MKRNMDKWTENLLKADKKQSTIILSFPSVQLMGITVRELISDSDLQAKGMKLVADRTPDAGASVSFMDLSVEAECFGAKILVTEDEIPTVTEPVIDPDDDEDEHLEAAEKMMIPKVGSGRTQIYIDAIKKAVDLIEDRPVLAGVIGPFSLAGRLLDVSSALIYCHTEGEMLHIVLEKVTEFLINYIREYKKAGANGVVIAEPLAGILSPALAPEFSGQYVKRIVDAVKSEDFAVIYHNCGDTANITLDSIMMAGANAYHFGNAVDMEEILQKVPSDVICMGNVDPAGEFKNGTVESITKTTKELMNKCCKYKNFVISSGCDIPPESKWENVDAYFDAVNDFYRNR